MRTYTGKILSLALALAALALNPSVIQEAKAASWGTAGSMNTAHCNHTATLLPNGKLLVVSGGSTELYDPARGTWTATVSMISPRSVHTATLLPNGKVLVTGGLGGGGALSSAELYDPASGAWTATGSMTTARCYHTATLLPNGKVLVAGGIGNSGGCLSSAELYDPASGTWTETGTLTTARYNHTATLLPNGKVLVAGGNDGDSQHHYFSSSAELYDPASGMWTPTGSLTTARYWHTSTLLPNGKVLVAGGCGIAGYLINAELYDPASGTWTPTGSLANKRAFFTAMLMPNGKVLAVGGYDERGPTQPIYVGSAELYDPVSGTWTGAGSLSTGRCWHTATLLANGKLLVTGGHNWCCGDLSSAELYDSASGTWTATGSLTAGRYSHTATLLPNGKVLVAGGDVQVYFNALSSAELYDPASGTWTNTAAMTIARQLHTATLLSDGKVVVAGGNPGSNGDGPYPPVSSAEVYDPAGGNWTATSPMTTNRQVHTATLLPNGKVLVAGGPRRHQCSFQRGGVRSGQRDMDGDQPDDHRTRSTYGDVAAQRQGAGHRGRDRQRQPFKRQAFQR